MVAHGLEPLAGRFDESQCGQCNLGGLGSYLGLEEALPFSQANKDTAVFNTAAMPGSCGSF